MFSKLKSWFTKNVDWADIMRRATKTFAQAAGAFVLAAGTTTVTPVLVVGAVIAGGAAVISLVWNFILAKVKARKAENGDI